MTRTHYRSGPHWALVCSKSTNQLGSPSLIRQLVGTNALGMALTQYGWVPVVSRPVRGTQDVAAHQWGRSLEIYWLRGSAFWPETSVRRAGQTKYLSPCVLYNLAGIVETVLSCFKSNLHNWVNSLFPVPKVWISSSLCIFSKCWYLLLHMQVWCYGPKTATQGVHLSSCHMDNWRQLYESLMCMVLNTVQRQQHLHQLWV